MSVDFKKLLEPITNDFVKNMQKLLDDKQELNKDLAEEIKKFQQEQRNIKIKIAENGKKLEIAKDTVAAEKMRQVNLNNQVKEEAARCSKLSKEYESKITEANQNLKDSQLEREIVADILVRAKKKESDYTTKTHFLKEDFAKSDTLAKELDEKEKKLNAIKKDLDRRQDEYIETGNNLTDTELRLKVKEKNIERLIKRYDLEKVANKES